MFRDEAGHDTIVFREDEEGRISHFLLGGLAIIAFERTPGHETPGLHLVVLGTSLLLFLATVLHLPVAGLVRRHYRVKLEPARRLPALTRLTAWLASAIFLTFMIGMGLVMRDPNEVVFGIGAGFKTLLVLPLIGLVVAIVGLYLAFRAWRDAQAGLIVRCFYSLVIVACFAFCWQLWVWNLFGFRY